MYWLAHAVYKQNAGEMFPLGTVCMFYIMDFKWDSFLATYVWKLSQDIDHPYEIQVKCNPP